MASWAAQQAWRFGGDEDGGVRVKMVEAIRATIHEAARRVCTCESEQPLDPDAHATDPEDCPARKVLEMEAGE